MLSPADIDEIRSQCFADDIELPAGAETWSENEVRRFFEGGGESAPATALYAVSDLHWDYEKNRAWVDMMPFGVHHSDAIILAGDISHDPALIEGCLRRFKAVFGEVRARSRWGLHMCARSCACGWASTYATQVLFVPGNHELWIKRGDANCEGKPPFVDSVEKLDWILHMCESRYRNRPSPTRRPLLCTQWRQPPTRCDTLGVRTQPTKIGGAVWVVPLLSWYESNLDGKATDASMEARAAGDIA